VAGEYLRDRQADDDSMSGSEPAAMPLSPSERQELEHLRARLASGRGGTDSTKRPAAWLRTTAAVVLITVGCALGPAAVAALWADGVVGDTDRYVETVAPLADDPDLQAAVTADITDEIFSRLDVDTLTDRAVAALGDQLPPDVAQQLAGLSGPLAAGVRSATEDQVARIVASDAFAQAWAEANRAAHDALVSALSGDDSGSLRVQDGTVSVDLSAFAGVVKERLADGGFALAERIPEIQAEFVILHSDDLGQIQRGYDLLDTLGRWLGPICFALIGLGVYVARDHRRALIGGGLGAAAAMLVSGILLLVARDAYLDAVPPEVLPSEAAGTLFDTSVRFLREVIRAIGLLGLVFALGAFFTGRSVTATSTRGVAVGAGRSIARWIGSMGAPLDRWGRPFSAHAQVWRIVLVLLAVAAFVVPRYPTPALVVWLTVGLLGALFLVQVLASAPRSPSTTQSA
jgi:hypothetical protein